MSKRFLRFHSIIFKIHREYLPSLPIFGLHGSHLRLPANVIAKGRGALYAGIVGAGHAANPKNPPFSTKVNCLRCAAPEALEGTVGATLWC